jgi:5,10-methylenetetrahydrofolate reductase
MYSLLWWEFYKIKLGIVHQAGKVGSVQSLVNLIKDWRYSSFFIEAAFYPAYASIS